MLKRLASTGLNLVVLGISVAVFLAAFFMMNVLGAAQRPPTVEILSAARDLDIGEVIAPEDLVVKTVFEDDNATLYIPAEEAGGVAGGIVAQPIFAGQPVFRTAILAPAGEGARLSAVLAEFPGYSLFPLPLDAMNIVAPDLSTFLPGDLIGVTLVIASRPQLYSTPTPQPEIPALPGFGGTPEPQESAVAEALERSFPPLAKDLFPEGLRVMAVQGLPPETTTDEEGGGFSYTTFDQAGVLVLLIPNESREILALALQQGDSLVVSLMARGADEPSTGFTYWDFEDLFKADREKVLGGGR